MNILYHSSVTWLYKFTIWCKALVTPGSSGTRLSFHVRAIHINGGKSRFVGQITEDANTPMCSISGKSSLRSHVSSVLSTLRCERLYADRCQTGRASSFFPHSVFPSTSWYTSKAAIEPHRFPPMCSDHLQNRQAEKYAVLHASHCSVIKNSQVLFPQKYIEAGLD